MGLTNLEENVLKHHRFFHTICKYLSITNLPASTVEEHLLVNFLLQGTFIQIRFTPGFFQARSFHNFPNMLDLESSKYVGIFRIMQPLLKEKLLQQSHCMKGIRSPIKLVLSLMGFKRWTHDYIFYYVTLRNLQKYQSYSLTNCRAQDVD